MRRLCNSSWIRASRISSFHQRGNLNCPSTPVCTGAYILHLPNFQCNKTILYLSLSFIAIQYQRSVAYTRNINMFAPGVSRPHKEYFGSGIYFGKFGGHATMITNVPSTVVWSEIKILKPPTNSSATVTGLSQQPQKHERSEATKQITEIKLNNNIVSAHNVTWLKYPTEIGEVCHNNVCCNYNITATPPVLQAIGYPIFHQLLGE